MKIRIKGNSIRFRLTRSEVSRLCETGNIQEETRFPNAIFHYGIQLVDDGDALNASLKKNRMLLDLPSKLGARWDAEPRVGFENQVKMENGQVLNLLLEKDFTCLENRGEDESDNYPNPKLVSKSN